MLCQYNFLNNCKFFSKVLINRLQLNLYSYIRKITFVQLTQISSTAFLMKGLGHDPDFGGSIRKYNIDEVKCVTSFSLLRTLRKNMLARPVNFRRNSD